MILILQRKYDKTFFSLFWKKKVEKKASKERAKQKYSVDISFSGSTYCAIFCRSKKQQQKKNPQYSFTCQTIAFSTQF